MSRGQRQRHLLQALRIVRGEPGEDDHADEAEHELEAVVLPEHPDKRCQDDADEAHEQELTPAGQAAAGRRSIERQAPNIPAHTMNVVATDSPVKASRMNANVTPVSAE